MKSISDFRLGAGCAPGLHKIQGISEGFIPVLANVAFVTDDALHIFIFSLTTLTNTLILLKNFKSEFKLK
jgi:hypothetical protein